MTDIRLVFPTLEMEEKALAFRQAFFDYGEHIINGSYKFDQAGRYTYSEWIKLLQENLAEETANPKFGVSETYFGVDGDVIVGIINFRHTLTPFYQNSGHIGYSVRPDVRGKGYATTMLRLLLPKAKATGLECVKLVCRADNIPSVKTILQNGGFLSRSFGDKEEKNEYIIIL